ncbi:MAG TPA: efflux RND transporter periplasmic adaptor subunit [Gammaproteobacteria bacterium]|nr:efflux RND transporter periplasmic adaptor subunit [Gammaproteobacteria bacterium]
MTNPPPDGARLQDLDALRLDPQLRAGATGRSGRTAMRLGLLGLSALSLIGGWIYFERPAFLLHEVPVVRVTRTFPSQAITLFTATGFVVPQVRAQVASKATGRITALEVREGDRVEAGQVLARLENADLEAARARAVANVMVSEAQVSAARAQLAEARARLTEFEAEARDAARVRKRAEQVARERFLAEQDRDAAIARDEKAAATVTRARAAIDTAVAQIAIAEAQVEAARAALREAEVAVEYTIIRAPFTGVVLEKFADIGDVVAPFAATAAAKGAVVTLADLQSLEVEADVAEASLVRAQVGQPAEIVFDALPDIHLRGRVRQLVPTVDRGTATVLVKVALVDSDPRVLPGMSARVAFLARELEFDEQLARLTVPLEAVDERGGERVVWRVGPGGHLERVALGELPILGEWQVVSMPLGAEVRTDAGAWSAAGTRSIPTRSALVEGDNVVLGPGLELQPGQRIRGRPLGGQDHE